MKKFIAKHEDSVAFVLSGFDRLRFRGSITLFTDGAGLQDFSRQHGFEFCRARHFFQEITAAVVAGGASIADRLGRPLIYLPSSNSFKQKIAQEIAEDDGIQDGLVCVLTCVEPCWSYGFTREETGVEWRPRWRKCLHQYFYVMDREFGLCHVRIQTWCPFTVNVCINGRHWLARRMQSRGIKFTQADNCFLEIDDPAQAQRLALGQMRRGFNRILNRLVSQWHPAWLSRLTYEGRPMDYYWSTRECEWATDIVFHSRSSLDAIYEDLIRFGLQRFSSTSVLRFLGQKLTALGNPLPQLKSEVFSDCRGRPEGIRLRHWAGGNSVKMYNKKHRVLRVETTITSPGDFKTVRPTLDNPNSEAKRRPNPKGVHSIALTAKAAQGVNDRYADALAAADVPQEELNDFLQPLTQRTTLNGRPVRGLRIFHELDMRLFAAIGSGEFAISGFRNRDIRALLQSTELADGEQAKLTNRVTRLLRMLRAHNLIEKIANSHRYQLTDKGNQLVAATATMKKASLQQLLALAA